MRNMIIGVFLGVGLVWVAWTYLRSDMNSECYDAGQRGDYERQVEACTAFIDRASMVGLDAAVLYNNRGSAYLALGQYEEALADLTAAIEDEPEMVNALLNRAATYAQMERYERGIEDIDRALALVPNSVTAYVGRSRLLRELGRMEEALADLDRALKLAPANFTALHDRAELRDHLGDNVAAIEDCNAVLALSPEDAKCHYRLAWLHYRLDGAEQALVHATAARELVPQSSYVHDIYARVAVRLGQLDDALAAFDDALGQEDSDYVLRLEQALLDNGYNPGQVDGEPARETLQAISACLGDGCGLFN